MAMRQDCKFFESRTYPNGDTLSECTLNLAPEAPWRCPTDCPSYERRRVDVNISHQKLAMDEPIDEPDSLDEGDDTVAQILADAASIVDEAAPAIVEEVKKESRRRLMLRRFRSRKRRGGKGKKS